MDAWCHRRAEALIGAFMIAYSPAKAAHRRARGVAQEHCTDQCLCARERAQRDIVAKAHVREVTDKPSIAAGACTRPMNVRTRPTNVLLRGGVSRFDPHRSASGGATHASGAALGELFDGIGGLDAGHSAFGGLHELRTRRDPPPEEAGDDVTMLLKHCPTFARGEVDSNEDSRGDVTVYLQTSANTSSS